MVVDNLNTVGFEEGALDFGTAEGKGGREAALGVDDFVAGVKVGARIVMEHVTDDSRPAGIPQGSSNLTISYNSALGNPQ